MMYLVYMCVLATVAMCVCVFKNYVCRQAKVYRVLAICRTCTHTNFFFSHVAIRNSLRSNKYYQGTATTTTPTPTPTPTTINTTTTTTTATTTLPRLLLLLLILLATTTTWYFRYTYRYMQFPHSAPSRPNQPIVFPSTASKSTEST